MARRGDLIQLTCRHCGENYIVHNYKNRPSVRLQLCPKCCSNPAIRLMYEKRGGERRVSRRSRNKNRRGPSEAALSKPETYLPLSIRFVKRRRGAESTEVVHDADSRYCEIVNQSDGSTLYRFEDMDEAIGEKPDFDYNDIVIRARIEGTDLVLTVEETLCARKSDVYLRDRKIFDQVGGKEKAHKGESVRIPLL